MYSEAAIQARRCLGRRRDGALCRAWAVWDDARQLCVSHAGRHHTGPIYLVVKRRRRRTNYRPCYCSAFSWPHRPGSGGCNWPLGARHMLTWIE